MFQDALCVKTWLDLLKELWSYWGFKLTVSDTPNFQRPLVSEVQERA